MWQVQSSSASIFPVYALRIAEFGRILVRRFGRQWRVCCSGDSAISECQLRQGQASAGRRISIPLHSPSSCVTLCSIPHSSPFPLHGCYCLPLQNLNQQIADFLHTAVSVRGTAAFASCLLFLLSEILSCSPPARRTGQLLELG